VADLLDEARALLAAATPGPWTHDGPGSGLEYPERCFILGDGTIVADYPRPGNGRGDANAALIARAPELLAALVARLERAERIEAHLRAALYEALEGWRVCSDRSERSTWAKDRDREDLLRLLAVADGRAALEAK
jgi:hypothetical protein